jgi:transposase
LVYLYSQEREARVAAEARVAELEQLARRDQQAEAAEGAQQCRDLQEQIEELQRENTALKAQLAQAERAAHVQAAPFRRPRDKRKTAPRKPGRPTGHPPAFRRAPERVDEEVEVPLARCPDCGGPLENVRPVTQVIEDIEVCVRRVQLTTHTGQCGRCGRVRSTHPAQVSTAQGAAGTQIGARALGLAAYLNKDLKLTVRKTCALLKQLGLALTPGGLAQALARLGERLAEPFGQLQQELRASPVVHADETGWWLEGRSAWLWDFTTPNLTLFTIDNRSQEVIRRVLGDDYAGVLISDCLASYDPHPGRKSKCVAHHLKAIQSARERTPGSDYLREMWLFWTAALKLHPLGKRLHPERYAAHVAHLEHWLDQLLADPRDDPDEQRIANRFRKQRPHLLTFLYVPGVDPTNNLAERQLRPAVIARKLSAGNKTDRGRRTFEILASLAATCHQRGADFAELVARAATLATPTPALPRPP